MEKEYTAYEKLVFGMRLGILSSSYAILAVLFLKSILGIEFSSNDLDSPELTFDSVDFLFLGFTLVVFAPVIEEFLFRLLPIKIGRIFGKKFLFLMIFLVSFILFGWIHGGPQYILIQGVSGLIFAYAFLKKGGYWTSVFAHATHNFVIFSAIILLSF